LNLRSLIGVVLRERKGRERAAKQKQGPADFGARSESVLRESLRGAAATNMIATLSSVLGLAIASGVNLYAAILVTGLAIRFGWATGLPGDLRVLAHPAVLSAAAVMYALEFFADKIPFVSVAWDAVHTFLRPLGGAALALAATANLSPMAQILAVLAGGSIAFGSHATKMGYRVLAHASPEPVSASIFSLAEDFGVAGLVMLIFRHPLAALFAIAALLIGMAILLPLIARIVTSFFKRVAGWFAPRRPSPISPPNA
jgi:hypothetical protein